MNSAALATILMSLREARFRDLAGARIGAFIPVPQGLLDAVVAATMPPNLPVREVTVRPEAGNRFSVRIAPKAAFIPQVTLKVDIEKQPQFPTDPTLVLRMATLGGLLGIASAAFPIASLLPPGVRLEGERIVVDLRELAHREGLADLVDLVRELTVTTEPGVMLVQLEAGAG